MNRRARDRPPVARIDGSSGALCYASDRNGGTAQVRFAGLSPGLALTYLDVHVV
jgi:hypothetical protein